MGNYNIKDLQRVVKRVVTEERIADALREEVNRVLGPSVVVDARDRIKVVAEVANDRIDVLEATGNSSAGFPFKPSLMVKFMDHNDPEVRKLAARVVPERYLDSMKFDRNHMVRAAVAKRVPLNNVSEMLKKFPNDDQLRVIFKKRRIEEAGLPKPKVEDEPFDLYGNERLGRKSNHDDVDLSEQWYRDQAERFIHDYGRQIEQSWKNVAVRRFVSSIKATSNIEINGDKLLEAIDDLLGEREDRALERSSLKETLDWLKDREEDELMNESFMPIIEFDEDPVADLVNSRLPSSAYIERANEIFSVRESALPPGIKMYRLGEGRKSNVTVPVVGKLPHGGSFRAIDEQALDLYCECWNSRQSIDGEPLRLEWSVNPGVEGRISFSVILR